MSVLRRIEHEEGQSRNILFLAVNSSYAHTNLAGGYLGAVAQAAGWSWRTLETLENAGLPGLLHVMEQYRPRILAASFYLFNKRRLLSIIRRFKALQPGCIVIGGGPEFDGENRVFLSGEPAVDLVVRGDGESAFGEWLSCFDGRKRWREIDGLCFCDQQGRYHDGGWAVCAPDLDALPSPYDALPDITRKPFMQLETTRGCTNSCVFCREGGCRGLRTFGLKRVRRELRHLRSMGVREVRLLDRTFNEPAARARRLLNMLIGEFGEIRFHLEIDPARLTQAMVKVMGAAPAGRFYLEAGVQTLNEGAWLRVRRQANPRRALTGLRTLCAMKNLTVHADLIAGLPGTDLKTLHADINTVVAAGPAHVQLETLKVLPGTVMRRTAAAEGMVYAPEPPYEVLRTRDMSPADLQTAVCWSRALDWFYNTAPLRDTVRAAVLRFPDFWERAAVVVRDHAPAAGMPGLRNRFLWLAGMVAPAPELVDALRFEWMLQGLGERAGFIVPRPWREPVPAGAEAVSGKPMPYCRSARRVWARLGGDYIFEYQGAAGARERTAAYRLPPGKIRDRAVFK